MRRYAFGGEETPAAKKMDQEGSLASRWDLSKLTTFLGEIQLFETARVAKTIDHVSAVPPITKYM